MPLKWKIYYWCSWILFAWCIVTLVVLMYELAEHSSRIINGALPVIMIILIGLLIVQSIFAMRLTLHLKNSTLFSEKENKLSQTINILSTIFAVMLGLAAIYRVPSMLRQTYYLQVLSNIFAVSAVVSANYVGFMHNKVKAAISKQYFAGIETIGSNVDDL